MELPFDHFRLLGVSPAADAQTVLHTLKLRLDRPPDQGFTPETLQTRAELLRSSADLLSNSERRERYEADLTNLSSAEASLVPGLEVPPSKEVAGLLLLLEAGQGAEAFEAARRGLNPPQAPALGSSREADLTLLAALACQASAEDYHKERRYEAAAQTLQLGLQLLQRMGQLPASRQMIERSLAALLPYRILDLLSRDLAAVAERQEGLHLLEHLVQQRGGLDGPGDADFSPEEFQAFFKQIRQFLTVQEQVDLFSHWAVPSSPTAGFLASYALTASGFSQRKPERIAAARERLVAGGQAGMEPYLACLSLLLGQVEVAQSLFAQGASEPLRQWAAEQGDEPLAGLCAYCIDWLDREVLPGYRDIEVEVDLEAWFADRDVQLYVEREDRKMARGGEAVSSAASVPSESTNLLAEWSPAISGLGTYPAPTAATGAAGRDDGAEEDDLDWPSWPWPQLHWPRWGRSLQAISAWRPPELRLPTPGGPSLKRPVFRRPTFNVPRFNLAKLNLPEQPRWTRAAALSVLALGVAAGGFALVRQRLAPGTPQAGMAPSASVPPLTQPVSPPVVKPAPSLPATLPLESDEPTPEELQALLEAWLKAKAAVLAGGSASLPLEELARTPQVERLRRQRREDEAAGRIEEIRSSVRRFTVTNRAANRIEAEVELSYSDELRNRQGQVLKRTPEGSRSNRYVFGRDGKTWKLVFFRPLA
ncbi:IMS domain-containing protein [Cyanobium sp. Morenito 9A2]|uniref:IMS domain-containing protein n=1 Tax=Cyanobium sp. Morenito 9A2 TaxID=2823718 RepID=UPI0020CEA8CB|nr:IMS domain-containing protein [Cyanobium sp. Morenito 9A2]MCP9849727.1 DUF4101 domain-containing protein [Cyanobium sp. Morenito 9A2]